MPRKGLGLEWGQTQSGIRPRVGLSLEWDQAQSRIWPRVGFGLVRDYAQSGIRPCAIRSRVGLCLEWDQAQRGIRPRVGSSDHSLFLRVFVSKPIRFISKYSIYHVKLKSFPFNILNDEYIQPKKPPTCFALLTSLESCNLAVLLYVTFNSFRKNS